MNNIIKISYRNLKRNSRRTLLTSSLITLGVIFVLVYTALSGGFKSYMIGQITDSLLGHIQIHKKGYVASMDNLPLDKNLNKKQLDRIDKIIKDNPLIESYAYNMKFGAIFSNYKSSTNIRLNAINPEKAFKTLPLLKQRATGKGLKRGEILVPELIARGMKIKIGDTIVLIANNKNGSVNGINLKVAGIMTTVSGPGGKDGYIHIADAKKVLRIKDTETPEVIIRLKNLKDMPKVMKQLAPLKEILNKKGKPIFEVHQWKQLTPFYNIVKMLDLMNVFIKVILISIVLISILNVMIMSVYERIKEIGTIAAMGTTPSTIIKLFLAEGLMLGVLGAFLGSVSSVIIVKIIDVSQVTYSFGKQSNLILEPILKWNDIVLISVIVIIISLIASISPSMKAAKLDPVEALRAN
jgi:putative ABC transport system permease protein